MSWQHTVFSLQSMIIQLFSQLSRSTATLRHSMQCWRLVCFVPCITVRQLTAKVRQLLKKSKPSLLVCDALNPALHSSVFVIEGRTELFAVCRPILLLLHPRPISRREMQRIATWTVVAAKRGTAGECTMPIPRLCAMHVNTFRGCVKFQEWGCSFQIAAQKMALEILSYMLDYRHKDLHANSLRPVSIPGNAVNMSQEGLVNWTKNWLSTC